MSSWKYRIVRKNGKIVSITRISGSGGEGFVRSLYHYKGRIKGINKKSRTNKNIKSKESLVTPTLKSLYQSNVIKPKQTLKNINLKQNFSNVKSKLNVYNKLKSNKKKSYKKLIKNVISNVKQKFSQEKYFNYSLSNNQPKISKPKPSFLDVINVNNKHKKSTFQKLMTSNIYSRNKKFYPIGKLESTKSVIKRMKKDPYYKPRTHSQFWKGIEKKMLEKAYELRESAMKDKSVFKPLPKTIASLSLISGSVIPEVLSLATKPQERFEIYEKYKKNKGKLEPNIYESKIKQPELTHANWQILKSIGKQIGYIGLGAGIEKGVNYFSDFSPSIIKEPKYYGVSRSIKINGKPATYTKFKTIEPKITKASLFNRNPDFIINYKGRSTPVNVELMKGEELSFRVPRSKPNLRLTTRAKQIKLIGKNPISTELHGKESQFIKLGKIEIKHPGRPAIRFKLKSLNKPEEIANLNLFKNWKSKLMRESFGGDYYVVHTTSKTKPLLTTSKFIPENKFITDKYYHISHPKYKYYGIFEKENKLFSGFGRGGNRSSSYGKLYNTSLKSGIKSLYPTSLEAPSPMISNYESVYKSSNLKNTYDVLKTRDFKINISKPVFSLGLKEFKSESNYKIEPSNNLLSKQFYKTEKLIIPKKESFLGSQVVYKTEQPILKYEKANKTKTEKIIRPKITENLEETIPIIKIRNIKRHKHKLILTDIGKSASAEMLKKDTITDYINDVENKKINKIDNELKKIVETKFIKDIQNINKPDIISKKKTNTKNKNSIITKNSNLSIIRDLKLRTKSSNINKIKSSLPLFKKFKYNFLKKSKKSFLQPFKVQIKSFGKWIDVKTPKKLNYYSAWNKGASIVDKYKERSFRLIPTSGKATKLAKSFSFRKNRFYRPGKTKGLLGAFIEKSKYAINTKSELRGITYRGIMAKKLKKIKSDWGFNI